MNKKILIADDDRLLVRLIKTALVKEGYEIKYAYDGATTLKLIKEFCPDVIVLDVMMPVLDGYKICQMINENSQYNPIPKIIIATSRKSDIDKRISKIIGADSFINKPYTPSELISKINELLKK
jgi:DNA-binding response OmpR family regulator